MKKSCFLIFLITTLACNNASNKNTAASGDTTTIDDSAHKAAASESNPILAELNKKILNSIKKKEYQSLANHIHPTLGLRFTPYATVNVNNDVLIKSAELLK